MNFYFIIIIIKKNKKKLDISYIIDFPEEIVILEINISNY